jgi:hypothetical protein
MPLPGLVAARNLADVEDTERVWDNLGSSLATGDIAIAAPSLDLNFAANKSLIDDISGNNLITFSRASTGTFVGSNGLIQTAASGVPRFDHDPSTGESLGLLVEEARTNALLNSDALSTQSVTVTAAARTLSFYGTGTITLSGVSTAGPLVGTGAYPSRSILTFTPTAGALTLTVTGSVQFAQLETGSFATSYIPTVASGVTRAADTVSIAGANFSSWYRQSDGSFWLDASILKASATSQIVIGSTSLAPVEGVHFFNNTVTAARLRVLTLGIAQVDTTTTPTYEGAKWAWTYRLNDCKLFKNSAIVAADNLATMPTASTQLVIGSNGQKLISRLTYWPTRLDDRILQYITQPSISSINAYSSSLVIKGRDILALREARNTSPRDFIFIRGLSSAAQLRLTTTATSTSSGLTLATNALPKLSPSSNGNYLFASGFTLSGVTTRINGTDALSIATSPFSGSTATAPLLFRELRPRANWRFTEPMISGTIASPELAIPFETNDFVLFMKAGQN